jgi:hypothetical protein
LRRFGGVSVAGASSRNPERSEGPLQTRFLVKWWPGTESNGQGALKTGKLLIFQRPKKPKNLKKPIWRYTRGTRKIVKPRFYSPALAKRITEKKPKSSISA